MNTKELLIEAERLGVTLRVLDGRLEATDLAKFDKETLSLLKIHEQEIIQLMCERDPNLTIPDYSKPYITENGELIIPTNCHPKYKYWLRDVKSSWQPVNKSQSVKDTLQELGATDHVLKRYI